MEYNEICLLNSIAKGPIFAQEQWWIDSNPILLEQGRFIVQNIDLNAVATKNERLAVIVERYLASPAAYKLVDMLSSVAQLEVEAKIEYMELVRDSGLYTDEEIHAIERLIISGAAQYFKDAIDQVREEQVQREIEDMLV